MTLLLLDLVQQLLLVQLVSVTSLAVLEAWVYNVAFGTVVLAWQSHCSCT